MEAVQRTSGLSAGLVPELTLDLSSIPTAFPGAVLPLVVLCRDLRGRDVDVRLILPEAPHLGLLFRNANWAHLIDPNNFGEEAFKSGHNLPATEYRSSTDQQAVVSLAVDLLLEEAHIDRPLLAGLEWCLNEVTDNVLVHAKDPSGGVVHVTRFESSVQIVVCDAGLGIAASMRAQFPDLDDDVAAAQEALLPGVTSGPGQGNGLAGIKSIADLAGGKITILTNSALGLISGSGLDNRAEWKTVFEHVSFPGTALSLQLPLDIHLDLREALSFQSPDWEPYDLIDSRYETGHEGGTFEIRIAKERRGAGSREAGRALRTKVENLLSSDGDARVHIDFDGVAMISSSFADEFLGKLRAELGPEAFDRRVGLQRFTPDVQTVIAGAVSQRMRTAQEVKSEAAFELVDDPELPADS